MNTGRRQSMAAAVFAIAACMPALAAAEPDWIAGARRALAENIPLAAIEKLKPALESQTLGGDSRIDGLRLLAEAQLDANQPAEALETLGKISAADDRTTTRLRAMAAMHLGRWQDALPHFHALRDGDADMAALAGEAECLQAMGRAAEAVVVLRLAVRGGDVPATLHLRLGALLIEMDRIKQARAILTSTTAATAADRLWQTYLEARIHLREQRPAAALAALVPLLGGAPNSPPEGLTPGLHAAATVAEAEARFAAKGPEIAEKILEAFIRQNPGSPHLETVFRRLDRIYEKDPNTDEGPLSRMAAELPREAAALAQFYHARVHIRARRHDLADESLRKFLDRFADHPLTPYVHAALAETAQARGNLTAAEVALDAASRTALTDGLRGELALQTALLNLQQGEFVRASTGFRTAALRSPTLKISARYDSALAWLKQKNFEHFEEEFTAFSSEFTEPTLSGNLRLEEGLTRARTGDPQAPPTLRQFLTQFPAHPRRAEAQLALAEISLAAGDTAGAEKLRQTVASADATPEMRERAEYLGVFLDDAKMPRDDEQTIARARGFIRQFPASDVLGEVRMKLGEIYFRREDYLKAQEQFETLAKALPAGPHAGPALFLAGQCSMRLLNTDSLNRALELFGAVVEKHGPLEPHARLHQAIIKNKLGAPDDAVKIYDSILDTQPPVDLELRLAAMTGRADNLVILGKNDPKQLDAAIASYDQIVAIEKASPTWRNQAAYKKAKVLVQQKKEDEAFTLLYEILDKAKTGPRETFWFAKAGYDAVEIAERRQQWKSAVGIYEKMAAVPGPHTEQAKQRMRRLRLEHFLWD